MKRMIFAASAFCVMATMTVSAQSQPGAKKILIAYSPCPKQAALTPYRGEQGRC